MIYDLRKLKISNAYEGNFRFEESLDDSLLNSLGDAKFISPVVVEGYYYLNDNDFEVDGDITFELKGECSRCLAEVDESFTIPFNELFVKNPKGDEYEIVKDVVDLKKAVCDAIMSQLPIRLLCDENCKGICLGCGVNLNKEECKCNNK